MLVFTAPQAIRMDCSQMENPWFGNVRTYDSVTATLYCRVYYDQPRLADCSRYEKDIIERKAYEKKQA